ncbi:MAG TPA: hypothetical protein VI968_00585 [archaeon]|nr:hypothetical protein [archaeon]
MEHEQYLSEYKILLTTTLTIMFGLAVGVASENIPTVVDKALAIYVILIIGLAAFKIMQKYYTNILEKLRYRIRVGE